MPKAAATIVKNLFSMSAMRIGTAALSFVLFWSIARWAGAESLGAYTLLFTIYLFLQPLPLCGLNLALTRDAASDPGRLSVRIKACMLVAGTGAIVLAAAVSILGYHFYPDQLHTAIYHIGLSLLPTAFIVVTEAALIGQQKMTLIAVVNVAETLYRVAVTILLMFAGYGLSAWFLALLLGRLGVACIYFRKAGLPSWWDAPWATEELKIYLSQMPVFFGILLASTAISRMDIFILSRFVSLELIGQYAVAAKIFEITGMVSAVAVTTIYPAFSKLYANDGKRFNDVFAFAFKWALLLATPTFLLLLVPLDDAILLVFGNSFKLAADLAPWLFFAALFVALSQALSMGFLVQHSQKLDFFALAIGLFITFFFVLAGAMWSGAVGAAKAMLISYFVQFSIRIGLFSRNDSGRHLLKTIAAPCLAILIAGACWLSLGSDARLVEVIVVVAVYILIVWFSKAITPADVMEFRTLVSARTR